MSLRYRLLLVYLIVVLLTAATVGVALVELRHSREVISELRRWDNIVLKVALLRAAFEREALLPLVAGEAPPAPHDLDFPTLLSEARSQLQEYARWQLNYVNQTYTEWREMAAALATRPAAETGDGPVDGRLSRADTTALAEQTQLVRSQLALAVDVLVAEQNEVVRKADEQGGRTMTVLGVVCALTALHVFMVGWLLRRWLLLPMSRLSRQVEALAHDAPPGEPLVAAPPEMSSLATALEQARVSLGEMRSRLIESERMTALGQFAAQMAHNLRNPLASIRALAQVAARQDATNSYVRERMGEIVAAVDRLDRWIAGLMEVVRYQATPTSRGDIRPTLQRVREAVQAELAAKELTLDVQTPAGEVVCAHDPDTLEHALIAMIVNAIEASPVGGRITVRIESDLGRVCRISVTDQGPGLPLDDPERIFDSSYSTKQQGLGLGLALTRLALERQGGRTGALNSPGGGATVYVELPLGSGGT